MKNFRWTGKASSRVLPVMALNLSLLCAAGFLEAQAHSLLPHATNASVGASAAKGEQEPAIPAKSGPGSNVVLTAISPGASLLNSSTLLAGIAILNGGTNTASNVTVTTLTLTGGSRISPALPLNLGTIAADGQTPLHASFSGSFAPSSQYTISASGAYTVGPLTYPFNVSLVLTTSPASPGSATAQTSNVGSHSVTGAPYPHQPLNFGDEVNRSGWTVPTGPFVAGTPTPTGTGVQGIGNRAVGKAALSVGKSGPSAPADVVFKVNNSMGLPSGGSNGTVSGTAEPSGARNGESVIFATANWVGAYSTTGGSSFTNLDPTTIFPNDAVGYCCDQIVQYVPSIDRFIWLLQGNGNRIAVASPADVVSSGGTAWTYWNLTPDVFGQPSGTGFDYPDLSVGTNYLYISWDAGWPGCPAGCNKGREVARIQLSQLQAGGTIGIDYTTPSDSGDAWGGHLMQDTQDEIFWAGHDQNQQLRVFSWAEGSNTYFWREVGIASWANNGLVSNTPDSMNWDGFGFPGNSVIGLTRSGNQLWLAWSAGTDNNFPQDHVEMVTLDRGNNFNVLQQVQIWNSGYAFAYPALATNGCTGEVGLSLEYGGGGNYENHVVGFWGDFVVYATTNSNVGSTRFGDYVTIRQEYLRDRETPYFDAFGYGLNSSMSGTQTDVHYVSFGRSSCGNAKAEVKKIK